MRSFKGIICNSHYSDSLQLSILRQVCHPHKISHKLQVEGYISLVPGFQSPHEKGPVTIGDVAQPSSGVTMMAYSVNSRQEQLEFYDNQKKC